ncbi:hypothetical protein ALC57_08792, partial [Trachymyrmex cornetzi]
HLFASVNARKQRKEIKEWRPSKIEMQEGFLLHVKIIGDLQVQLDLREKKLAQYSCPLQPLVAIVGPKLEEINQNFVVLGARKYFEVNTPLKAIDVCFKIFHALHIATKENNIVKGKYVPICGQYIPLNLILKKFFELTNALANTLTYMESLNKQNSELHNFIQGRLWAKKRQKYSKYDIVLPLFVYFDDVEVNNPLGSHCGKLGAVYVSLPCLPPECHSLLKNIFPVFQGLKRVFFVLGLITGDNLGLNGVLGLVESFSACFFCRFCKMHKNDTQQVEKGTTEDPALLRNVFNYNDNIQLWNVSETGLKENCVFHDIPSFHMTDNYSADELHDVREGLCNIDMIHILNNLTNDKYKCFDLTSLNNRMLMFDYGPKHSINKPPCISIDSLKRKKLKMTGSEMLC